MRGGLERLGANSHVLTQMQALSQNLAQHRTPATTPIDNQQSLGEQASVSFPSGSASKGPRLPLRPKPQQLTTHTASEQHTQQTPRLPPSAQGPMPMAKQLQVSDGIPTGQENSFQSWHMLTPSHSHGHSSTYASAHAADTSAPHEPTASSSNSRAAQHASQAVQQDLPTTSIAHAFMGGDYSALASPDQLASNLQQAVMGQTEAASDVGASQEHLSPSHSHADKSPQHLGIASITLTINLTPLNSCSTGKPCLVRMLELTAVWCMQQLVNCIAHAYNL